MSRFDAIPADVPQVSTRASDFWLHDGLVYGRTRKGVPHGELQDAIAVVEKMRELTGGVPHPLLFDASEVGWLQMRAREHVHRHAAEMFTRAGVVVGSAMVRAMSHALLGFINPTIPVRIFTDEDEAYEFATA